MKALSIKQPWAAQIATGLKNIENRTWATKYRGRIYIHASGKPSFNNLTLNLSHDQIDALMVSKFNFPLDARNESYSKGAIIGEVDIVDCVLGHSSIWAEHSATVLRKGIEVEVPVYNWVLENAVLYEKPILNVKGALSLWEYGKPFEVIGMAEMVNQ